MEWISVVCIQIAAVVICCFESGVIGIRVSDDTVSVSMLG